MSSYVKSLDKVKQYTITWIALVSVWLAATSYVIHNATIQIIAQNGNWAVLAWSILILAWIFSCLSTTTKSTNKIIFRGIWDYLFIFVFSISWGVSVVTGLLFIPIIVSEMVLAYCGNKLLDSRTEAARLDDINSGGY
jgi:hypothetical protein